MVAEFMSGSASMRRTREPESRSTLAMRAERVLLPTPPFPVTAIFMLSAFRPEVGSALTRSHEKPITTLFSPRLYERGAAIL